MVASSENSADDMFSEQGKNQQHEEHNLLPYSPQTRLLTEKEYYPKEKKEFALTMGRSYLFASEKNDESESTAVADPLLLDDDDDDDDDYELVEDDKQIMVGAGVASGALGLYVHQTIA